MGFKRRESGVECKPSSVVIDTHGKDTAKSYFSRLSMDNGVKEVKVCMKVKQDGSRTFHIHNILFYNCIPMGKVSFKIALLSDGKTIKELHIECYPRDVQKHVVDLPKTVHTLEVRMQRFVFDEFETIDYQDTCN